MKTDFTIDGTAISTLGFFLKGVEGHKCAPGPKPAGNDAEPYSSVNHNILIYKKTSPEITVNFFGKFGSVAAAETALYTLYGMLVQVGERAFSHVAGASSISFKGIMHKGANVAYKFDGSGGIVFNVKLKILKTNED